MKTEELSRFVTGSEFGGREKVAESPDYTFLHFTDAHVGSDGNKPVHKRLQAAVALANRLKVDFVIDTGDITGSPVHGATEASLAEFTTYKECVSSLNMPLYVVPGNHDISYFNAEDDPRDITWADYGVLTAHFEQVIGPLNQSFVHKSGRFILANNVGEYSRMPGHLSAEQLTWIETEMQTAQANSEDIFVFVHIRPVTTNGSNEPWGRASEALINLCREYRVSLVTFGHDHQALQAVFDGVLYIECPDLNVEGHETVFQYRVFADYFEIWGYNVFDAGCPTLIATHKMNRQEVCRPNAPL